ncbi:hypothetical protein BAU26_10230 [Bacillus sp. N35-10-4]|uniref:hypothetical protein n=1 Tax=Bacillus sp. N35-10-4 TaxID=1866315 RepID=UPI0008FE229B|nr:hypothetical protein [Bacillus sp. N35-10-4]OJD66249.1 hypothetical protein BAU26_10230 [Bacillus sp. N35-10-4]
MKFTLFTISNEQIKEQLSKLQTKVESLETVKDVQDKIISTKDSQISFLNDQIANIWASVSIVVALIGLIASAVFAYVAWLNKQGAKIVKEGEEQIQIANQKIEEAENKIQQANDISTVAREKLEELEEKQKELNDLSSALANNQKVDITLNNIKFTLDFIKKSLMTLYPGIHDPLLNGTEQQKEEYTRFKSLYERLGNKHTKVSLNVNKEIKGGASLKQQDIEMINNLENECIELKTEIYDYLENL